MSARLGEVLLASMLASTFLGCGGSDQPTASATQLEEMPIPGTAAESGSGPQPLRIVLVTLEGLRVDSLPMGGGVASLVPSLHALQEASHFVGIGVASSSFAPASLASLWTGELPAVHGIVAARPARRLRAANRTLAQEFQSHGYHTSAWRDLLWLRRQTRGFDRGFDHFGWIGSLKRIEESFESGVHRNEFHWIGLRRPALPYERDDLLLEQLSGVVSLQQQRRLPWRLGHEELEGLTANQESAEARLTLRHFHANNLARADRLVGAIVRMLERSDPEWRSTLLVVMGINGQSLLEAEASSAGLDQEAPTVGAGTSLRPEQILVPVLLRAPQGASGTDPALALPPHGSTVSLLDFSPTLRAWARFLEGRPMTRSESGSPPRTTWSENYDFPALSELNLAGDRQLWALYGPSHAVQWSLRSTNGEQDRFAAFGCPRERCQSRVWKWRTREVLEGPDAAALGTRFEHVLREELSRRVPVP